jgi:glutathione S-transferase
MPLAQGGAMRHFCRGQGICAGKPTAAVGGATALSGFRPSCVAEPSRLPLCFEERNRNRGEAARMAASNGPPRLIVLPPSHYCERARWGLEHKKIPFIEKNWAVGPHMLLARGLASGTSLPILQTDQAVIQGSDKILDWAGFERQAGDVEQRFESRIGPLVRRFIYSATLGGDRASDIRDLLLDGAPAWQALAGKIMWPATRRAMIASMSARPEFVNELAQALDAEIEWFDGLLSGGRDYLAGAGFGRADLTAASLMAPLVRPDACALYRRNVLPPALEDRIAVWAERPCFHWVRGIYARHRGQTGVSGAVPR